MVLNTSLNINREPIVETPIDALICVFGTAIDFLYIEGLLVECPPYANPEMVARLTADRAQTLDEEWKAITARHLTRYDTAERDAWLAEENRIAEWHREYRAKYELEQRLAAWKASTARGSSIVGTRGHTRCLYEYVDGFAGLEVAAFVPMDDQPGEPGELTRLSRGRARRDRLERPSMPCWSRRTNTRRWRSSRLEALVAARCRRARDVRRRRRQPAARAARTLGRS